jgi:hypothetical protein
MGPCSSASVNLIARSHYDHEYSSKAFSSTRKLAAPRRKLVTPGNRRGRSRISAVCASCCGGGSCSPTAFRSNSARAFDFLVLVILLEVDGSLVTKEELLSRVWPSVVVSAEALKVHVSALRKAMGTDRDLIRTEFGRGYRFTGVQRTNIALEPCQPIRSRR